MNSKYLLIAIALSCVGLHSNAHAEITFVVVDGDADQSRQSIVGVDATATAWSDRMGSNTLTVAVGFTVTCVSGGTPIKDVESNAYTGVVGSTQKTESISKNYLLFGYAAWEEGVHQCQIQTRGRAAEGAASATGTGFDFNLAPSQLVNRTETSSKVFQMTKGQGECGTQ